MTIRRPEWTTVRSAKPVAERSPAGFSGMALRTEVPGGLRRHEREPSRGRAGLDREGWTFESKGAVFESDRALQRVHRYSLRTSHSTLRPSRTTQC